MNRGTQKLEIYNVSSPTRVRTFNAVLYLIVRMKEKYHLFVYLFTVILIKKQDSNSKTYLSNVSQRKCNNVCFILS